MERELPESIERLMPSPARSDVCVDRLRAAVLDELFLWKTAYKASKSVAKHQIEGFKAELRAAVERADGLEQLFDQQHCRTVEADALYVAAHPRDDCPHGYRPDLGKVVEWLMERADAAEATVAALRSAFADAVIVPWGKKEGGWRCEWCDHTNEHGADCPLAQPNLAKDKVLLDTAEYESLKADSEAARGLLSLANELTAENERLRKALYRHGRHHDDCPKHSYQEEKADAD